MRSALSQKIILLVVSLLCFGASLFNFIHKAQIHQQLQNVPIHRRLQGSNQNDGLRILYIVTSLAEYDNGERATRLGRNRFTETLVPVVSESANSMRHAQGKTNQISVYLVCHYSVSQQRYDELKAALHPSVNLYVWSNATPYGYAFDNEDVPEDHLGLITRALARQHRFIVKDLLFKFDMFVAFEDDMLIKGEHVAHYLQLTQHLYDLRSNAPDSLPTDETLFYGPLTSIMLKRMIPGFMRVEVVPSADWQPELQRKNAQLNRFADISIDYNYAGERATLDASICCLRRRTTLNSLEPFRPQIEQLRYWETSIRALGVRQMPDKSWVLLQAGNDESLYDSSDTRIGEFWSGEDHEEEYFGGQARPGRSKGDFLNNQGGWMATRRQILEWHTEQCFGGFLPPYYEPAFQGDGISTATVEFWSGGIELVGIKACNLQRIIPLEPKGFSRGLLYHTSNNKQRQKYVKHRFAGTNIQEFWGQLNTIQQNAEAKKRKQIELLKAQYSV